MPDYYLKYDGGADGSTSTYSTLYINENFAPFIHNHDKRYFTKAELSTADLAKVHWKNITFKPDFSPEGLAVSHNHDQRYYTKNETQTYISNLVTAFAVSNLSSIYVRSGPAGSSGINQNVFGNKVYKQQAIFEDIVSFESDVNFDETLNATILNVRDDKITLNTEEIDNASIVYRGDESVINTNTDNGLVLVKNETSSEHRILTTREIEQINPIGEIGIFAGPVNKLPFWLDCNGSTYSVTSYLELFNVIGYTYGGSGGVFMVPDLRDRFIYGQGTNSIGFTSGAEWHTLTIDEIPQHTHQHAGLISNPTEDTEEIVPISGSTESVTGSVDLVQTIIPTSFAGGGNPHNNMPPYVVMKYMIRAKVIV